MCGFVSRLSFCSTGLCVCFYCASSTVFMISHLFRCYEISVLDEITVVQGGGMDHRQSFYFAVVLPCVIASLNAKQGGSFAFCLMPVPEVVVLEASPVFLASAAMKIMLGPVMHPKQQLS